jgi:AcrR family transcriptional regulator
MYDSFGSHAIVIGAGPRDCGGSLSQASAYSMHSSGKNDRVASAWHRHYDWLHLHTDKTNSALPFLPFPNAYLRIIILYDYFYIFGHRESIMPKAFSEHEKEIIRAQMRKKGKMLFEKHGLKKTSVDELTEAVGISKGAFYLFYESKEELFLEILEELESDFRSRIFDFSVSTKDDAQQLLSRLLKDALLTWDEYPLLKNFGISDYEYLARKLPPQRIQAHTNRDDEFVKDFINQIKQQGISVKASPRVVSNLMKSLFFLSLHRDDLGRDAYVETMEVLADLIACYTIEGA